MEARVHQYSTTAAHACHEQNILNQICELKSDPKVSTHITVTNDQLPCALDFGKLFHSNATKSMNNNAQQP
jgi:hypothetical protein